MSSGHSESDELELNPQLSYIEDAYDAFFLLLSILTCCIFGLLFKRKPHRYRSS